MGIGGKDEGAIEVLGLDHVRDEVAMKRQVGYVSPELSFSPWGRVRKVVQFVRGFYPEWDHEYCLRLLKAFSIGWHDPIATLSLGARTKLALVLALSWRPRLLILDEPTVGLDAISKQEVFAELLSAVRDGERTVFISSHGLSDLERFADHVGMIRSGHMLFEGPMSDVIDRFRMVDVIVPPSVTLEDQPGIVVQQKDGERWRLLVDQHLAPVELIMNRGIRPVSDAPVTLEDLFVALGRS